MTDYREQIDRLLVDSEGLEDGHTKVGLLEEAVRIADTHADVGLGFELRKELLGAALGAGMRINCWWLIPGVWPRSTKTRESITLPISCGNIDGFSAS